MTQYTRTVQYHETDKMGITHHSNYIKWMEEARIYLLEQIGFPFQEIEAHGISSPVIGITIDYKAPTTFGDKVIIEIKTKAYNGIQLEIEYIMRQAETGTLVASAVSKHCFLTNGKLCSLKKQDAALHAAFQAELERDIQNS